MHIISFSHYNLRAPRELLDLLREFYIKVVGLTDGARPPFKTFGYWLYIGSQDVLHLTESTQDEVGPMGTRSTFDHAAFSCTGLFEFKAKLSRQRIKYEVAEVPLTGQIQLFFNDPAGNGVELNFAQREG